MRSFRIGDRIMTELTDWDGPGPRVGTVVGRPCYSHEDDFMVVDVIWDDEPDYTDCIKENWVTLYNNNEQLEAIKKERDEALALLHEAYRAKNAALDCFEKENKIAYLRMAELENERDEALARVRELEAENAELRARPVITASNLRGETFTKVLIEETPAATSRIAELEAENAELYGLRRMLDEKDSSGKYTERAGLLRFLVADDGSVSARIAENERLRVAFDKQIAEHVGAHNFDLTQPWTPERNAWFVLAEIRAAMEGKDDENK
jgi:hypothetical protein